MNCPALCPALAAFCQPISRVCSNLLKNGDGASFTSVFFACLPSVVAYCLDHLQRLCRAAPRCATPASHKRLLFFAPRSANFPAALSARRSRRAPMCDGA
uniref:Secreted protein n=1 Tax=Plectus sambesii TaxID=2011161 RepID=A0A914VSH1_9BILA